jgi:uncharacterized protein (DUF58 family)
VNLAFWRRWRKSWRPPRILSVTGTGRTYLVVTLGVGLGALNTGNNLLYLVLGMLLSMIVVSGVLSERVLREVEVRRIGAEAAYAGEPFAFRWWVSSPKRAAFALTISEEDVALSGSAAVPYLERGGEHIARADLNATRRGPYKLSTIRVTTTYPLGLFSKTRLIEAEDLLLVFPRRRHPGRMPDEAGVGPMGNVGNPQRPGGSGDLLGLRDLRDGEDARQIHWLKSASLGKMLRTEREREERRTFVLQLDAQGPAEGLDARCEELAAQSHRLLSMGHEVGLDVGTMRLRPAGGGWQERRILHALAWAGYEADA